MKIKNLLFIPLFLLFSACLKPEKTADKKLFFDLKNYFEIQTIKLDAQKNPIFKEVKKDGISERKTVLIDDWKTELQLFSQSDINKPAWQNSYQLKRTGNNLLYTATDPSLKTQVLRVVFEEKKLKSITIENKTSNLLFTSREILSYEPGKEYKIDKKTKVWLLGNNDYLIIGSFLK